MDDVSPAARPLDSLEAAGLFRAVLAETGTCLLAVSGGPDSMAMMRLARLASPHLPGIVFHAATIDHGLRPESRGEALFVAEVARSIGMPHDILTWDEAKPVTGIQSAAREARYALLERHAIACNAKILMTAHTSDDQAETILMRLARGSGIDGLAGMRRTKPLGQIMLARPMLAIPKSRLVATCVHQGWEFVEDPSNHNENYTRVRMRAILPLLEAEGLSPHRLLRLGQRAGDASDALEHAAERAFDHALMKTNASGILLFDAAFLAQEPFDILRRVLARAIVAVSHEAAQPAYGPRMERLEALSRDVFDALRATSPMPARSLAGAEIAIETGRETGAVVSVRRSAPRRKA